MLRIKNRREYLQSSAYQRSEEADVDQGYSCRLHLSSTSSETDFDNITLSEERYVMPLAVVKAINASTTMRDF
jgi:hypothetical protein